MKSVSIAEMATPNTMTGSIGVIIQALNYKELMGKVGLDSVVFTSGNLVLNAIAKLRLRLVSLLSYVR